MTTKKKKETNNIEKLLESVIDSLDTTAFILIMVLLVQSCAITSAGNRIVSAIEKSYVQNTGKD